MKCCGVEKIMARQGLFGLPGCPDLTGLYPSFLIGKPDEEVALLHSIRELCRSLAQLNESSKGRQMSTNLVIRTAIFM
jgi:hypothetical protein